jgi:hypothetical protein
MAGRIPTELKNHNRSQPPEIQQSTMKPWKKLRNQKGKSDLLVGCCVQGVRRPWIQLVCCSGDDIRCFPLSSLLVFAFLVGDRRAIQGRSEGHSTGCTTAVENQSFVRGLYQKL